MGDCCGGIAKFTYVNNSYLQLNLNAVLQLQDTQLCLFLVNSSETATLVIHDEKAQLGSSVGLQFCHENASQLTFIEEGYFREKRKALLLPQPAVGDPNCEFPPCAINAKTPPVKLLPLSECSRCDNISECVTIVTKTFRNPKLILRMVQSFREQKGYDLPTIVYDDGGEPYPAGVMESLSNLPGLRYIVGDKEDLGTALGRNQVRTKYFLLFDDDTVITKRTDIELLAKILDTTDAACLINKRNNYS